MNFFKLVELVCFLLIKKKETYNKLKFETRILMERRLFILLNTSKKLND
jgi:hypothetical protein